MNAEIEKQMLTEDTWEEFEKADLLWWAAPSVLFASTTFTLSDLDGLVFEFDDAGSLSRVYPARCRFRGFSADVETKGFVALTEHLRDEMPTLLRDVEED